jgi:hypothetical protein
MNNVNSCQAISFVCESLTLADIGQAKAIARAHYPFRPTTYKEISASLITDRIRQAKETAKINSKPKTAVPDKRKWNALNYTKLFIRDGFTDRYSGRKLVFPGTLRLLSVLMPEEFPEHPNWALKHGHIMYWELLPTLDHVDPLARGGKDEESNWVSTSWLNNYIKSDFTLEEIGWTLQPAGKFEEWDGLMRWFIDYAERNAECLSHGFLNSWYVAARRCLEESSGEVSRI